MPVLEWPPIDQAGWRVALAPPDLLDSSVGYASRWKGSTCTLNQIGYGYWLDWLHQSGQLDATVGPGARATRQTVSAYRQSMEAAELASHTIAGRIQQLGCVLRAIAPDQDWVWLHKGASRLHASAKPVRDKRENLQPAEDILQLAHDLMHAAEHDRFRTSVERAVLYRDGLIIALFLTRVYRRGNIAAIEIGRHFEQRGDGWWLTFESSETKGGRTLGSRIPDDLAPRFDRYIDVHRPVLLACKRTPGPAIKGLWISKQGTQMTGSAIALQVGNRTKEQFGKAINPQRFRHIYATDTATVTPEHAKSIQHGLGHASKDTSDQYYNMADMVGAGRKHQATIAALREEMNPHEGRRKFHRTSNSEPNH